MIHDTNVLGTENALRAGRRVVVAGLLLGVRAEGARALRGRAARAEQRLRRREGGGHRAGRRRWRRRASALLGLRPVGGAEPPDPDAARARDRWRASSARVAASRTRLRPRRRRLRGVRPGGRSRARPRLQRRVGPTDDDRRRSSESHSACSTSTSSPNGARCRTVAGTPRPGLRTRADSRRARLGSADLPRGGPGAHARVAQDGGAAGNATDCPRSDRAEPQRLVGLDREAARRRTA